MSIYDNGKIYKLVNNVDDKIYVGSTCNLLRVRKARHKAKSKMEPDRRIYKHLNQVGWGNVEIILIENYECKSKEDLNKRERYWIDELKPELNKNIPTRTRKEYDIDNKETIKEKDKIRRKNDKEKIAERKKKYRENNREKLIESKKKYYEENKEKIAERERKYREQNKEKIAERRKKYGEKNKEINKERRSLTILCECGRTIQKVEKARHLRSAIHKQIMKINE